VGEIARSPQPESVHWLRRLREEYDALAQVLIDAGTFERLSDAKRPNSYHRPSPTPPTSPGSKTAPSSAPSRRRNAGPTNNWRDPAEMREVLSDLFKGSMIGRTMYVVPFSMGPIGSDISEIGVQLTDSAYVAVSMRIMTRMGKAPSTRSAPDGEFGPLRPLGRDAADRGRRGRLLALQRGQQVHRPLPGDARDLVLRLGLRRQRPARQEVLPPAGIASVMARDEDWLAEHMLILKLTSPEGKVQVITGAFRRPAARPTWRCWSRPCPNGRSRRSATTSPG